MKLNYMLSVYILLTFIICYETNELHAISNTNESAEYKTELEKNAEDFLFSFSASIVQINKDDISNEIKEHNIQKLLEESLDTDKILKTILASYYDELNSQELEQCKKEYMTKLISQYANSLSVFKGISNINFVKQMGSSSIILDTTNKFAATQKVPVRFIVTFNQETNNFKIFDIVVENKVSFVNSMKNVVQSRIKEFGLKNIIPTLI